MNLKTYIQDIEHRKELAKGISPDNPVMIIKKLELLVEAHQLLGDVAAECYLRYKTLDVDRKRVYWDAYENAKGNKQMAADRGAHETKMRAANYAGLARKYQNELESTKEEIHALKLKQRVNIADGNDQP